jgi:hypothetical protein
VVLRGRGPGLVGLVRWRVLGTASLQLAGLASKELARSRAQASGGQAEASEEVTSSTTVVDLVCGDSSCKVRLKAGCCLVLNGLCLAVDDARCMHTAKSQCSSLAFGASAVAHTLSSEGKALDGMFAAETATTKSLIVAWQVTLPLYGAQVEVAVREQPPSGLATPVSSQLSLASSLDTSGSMLAGSETFPAAGVYSRCRLPCWLAASTIMRAKAAMP